MKFHKGLVGQKYIPGAFWLILGLLAFFFWGKVWILNEIGKNSWRPVRAELVETRLLKSEKHRQMPQNAFRWKYKEKDRIYYGEDILSADSSPEFSAGRSIRILVNPEAPSESALFCWNDLTLSARILRVIFLLVGVGIAGLGLHILIRPPRKTTILVYECRKEPRGLFYYAVFPLSCLLFFGILAALILFLDERFFFLAYLFIFIFPLLIVRFMRKKTPPLFQISCPNPDCFSLKIKSMRQRALSENACPACGTPLGVPSRSPEKKWKRSDIPDSRFFPQTDSLPPLLFLSWILLLVPLAYFFYPPGVPRSMAARNSGMVLLVGWMMAGMFLMPFFMEVSRRWKLRRKKALVCPVCGSCLCERESIEALRQTGHCPACGADLVESE